MKISAQINVSTRVSIEAVRREMKLAARHLGGDKRRML
jgi:hypothetical protein